MALSAAMALSGLPRETFLEDTHYAFNHGAVLLSSPNNSAASPRSSSPTVSSDTGTCMSTESPAHNLDYYLDLISELEGRFLNAQQNNIFKSPVSNEDTVDEKEKICKDKIMYENRNILNLGDNLKSEWSFQYAASDPEVSDLVENKFQYSRINGAAVPRHLMVTCDVEDCGFNEPKYY